VRVVVAGAGFAGLMAAYRVAQAGHEVVVLEARARVGGRVRSQELVPGDPRTVVERGAEFVLDGYDLMRAVAGELGLRLADTAMSYYEREPRGGAATTHLEMARCAEVVAEAAGRARPGTSLAEVMEHDQDGVRVLTDDGEVGGDAVIVAVPMAVLRVLPFSPPVPGRYLSAWQRAGLAHNAKLHVPLTRPAAASAVQSVPDRFWTWTAADQTGQVQPVLHAFSGTEEGLAALAVSDGPATWAARAAALRPELAADLSRAMLTTWNDDPWAGESYSASTVTVATGDDELIAMPLGRVHFAGEHTAGPWAGLMEGALRSGARAGAEVLAHART
jgi:monoamine oxidase